MEFGLVVGVLSLVIWVWLLCFRGQFWRPDQLLRHSDTALNFWPTVCAIVPARNEADLLPVTLRSLLSQTYPGIFKVILVDDHSTDGTAAAAYQVAEELGKTNQLQVILAEPLPAGWTGKLWAMEQGIRKAQTLNPQPEFLLLTDADIQHSPTNLQDLVVKAEQDSLELASVMVRLRCQSFWEKLLIPAFVFFFQKLYPFRWINNPKSSMAGAAGGCILVRQTAMERIGGLQSVRQALIDDCALAQAIKAPPSGRAIWLGLTTSTLSLRPYDSLSTIWAMVARTAFTQLGYSTLLLLGTIIGMLVIYVFPPISAVLGSLTGNWPLALIGCTTWVLMSFMYWPTIRFYSCPIGFAAALPLIGFLYTLMTFDSALRHWQGKGGTWKGRIYSERLSGEME